MPAVFSTRKKGRKNLLKKKISRSFFECFLYSVTTFMKRGGSLWNNENIDIRGSHDALSWRFLTRNVAPNVSRSCAAFSAQFFGRILSKQTFPRCHPPSDQFLFFFFARSFLWEKGTNLSQATQACNNTRRAGTFFSVTAHRQIFL